MRCLPQVTPHEQCVVRVSVLEATLSGSHKVSLRAAMVVGGQVATSAVGMGRMDETLG